MQAQAWWSADMRWVPGRDECKHHDHAYAFYVAFLAEPPLDVTGGARAGYRPSSIQPTMT
ncbi:hypothetical protein X734_10815 [Mesorhizobium sp. L2C084A000]|nr:hypothetical protein X734_10815 [Mesorhizobium sp. L2C084A000]